ncbi:MAG: hypothetical protein FD137_766 [Spirochaetes bacterium]|nr:MAG: hypothetical protein FD137_766 [Spirochaetota bacterium]
MPIVALLLSAAFAAAFVPSVIHFAHSRGLYDTINERKVHNGKSQGLAALESPWPLYSRRSFFSPSTPPCMMH